MKKNLLFLICFTCCLSNDVIGQTLREMYPNSLNALEYLSDLPIQKGIVSDGLDVRAQFNELFKHFNFIPLRDTITYNHTVAVPNIRQLFDRSGNHGDVPQESRLSQHMIFKVSGGLALLAGAFYLGTLYSEYIKNL